MRDIHCHILYGIDDGSKTIDESIHIIENAVNNGYSDLILTPHYRESQNFIADNSKKKEIFDSLKERVKEENIKINLYLGNEITVDSEIFDNIKNGVVTTLAGSRYMLLELPFDTKLPSIHNIIFQLVSMGYVPVIAHPERYSAYDNNFDEFEQMINEGALLQGNMASLHNKYGERAKEMLKELLKRHMIHFIGSDIHHETSRSYHRINDVIARITDLTGSNDMAYELVEKNIGKVIKNQEIEPYQIRKPVKKMKFSLFRRK